MNFKPLLASPADLDNLRFPLLASPKLDGVRAIVKDGVVLSRSLKKIPNLHIQTLFGNSACEGMDGELIAGSPTSKTCYINTVSTVMRASSCAKAVRFHVFDDITWPKRGYFERRPRFKDSDNLVEVPQTIVHCLEDLLKMEEFHLTSGYEGLILRDPNAPYKYGRSTTKEGILLKLKRMETDEAVVLAVVEEQHNGNEATTSELGRTKRSSHQANKTGKGSMGALHVRDVKSGVDFHIGTGFTAEDRAAMWTTPPIGKIVSYNHFPIGAVDKPRHPSFKGFRDSRDL